MSDAKKAKLVALIYDKVNELLGGGDQLFAMQFPAQPLNYRTYAYDTSDRNSVMTRPYSVAEAEFRLSDQLFSASPIVQGPTGERLSAVYTTMINNYIPRLEDMAPFLRDRAGMAAFLVQDSGEVDEHGHPMSRIELSKLLYREYLEAKNKWNVQKNKTFDQYRRSNDLDGYATWLSSEGFVEQEALNNLYNDAVVRGHLHEVLTTLGYLNVSSTAEELEIAKQRMRHSVRMSLDESMLVYPVQFQPSNWFEALKPNLRPQDLTMAQEAIANDLRAKQQQLRRTQTRLSQIELIEVPQSEINRLEQEVAAAKTAMLQAEGALIKQWGSAAVTAAKIYLSARGKAGWDKAKAKQLGLIADDDQDPRIKAIESAVTGMAETHDRQQQMMAAAENLTALKARKANAEAHDLRFEKIQLQHRIQELEADIAYLGDLVAGVHREAQRQPDLQSMNEEELRTHAQTLTKDGAPLAVDANSSVDQLRAAIRSATEHRVLPSAGELSEADGLFMDVVIKSNETTDTTTANQAEAATSTQWSVSAWFGSASGKSSSARASTTQESEFMSKEFEMGFRVAKVGFDRGGWFNPQLFRMSKAFYRLADIRAGAGLTVKTVVEAAGEAADPTKYKDVNGQDAFYVLPAYTTGMVIAKDITIKVKSAQSASKSSKEHVENASSAGGGFFCFSVSSASSASSTSESAFHGQSGDYYYIRIPGPQILGYFLQFVPKDLAEMYKPMWEDGKESAAAKAFRMFDELNKRPPELGPPQRTVLDVKPKEAVGAGGD